MNTKRIVLLISLIAAAFALSACGIRVTRGSGIMATETRAVSDFDAIQIDGFGNLVITQGDTESLKIEAEDNILSHITSKVKGSTLYIGYEDNRWKTNIFPTESVTFYISVKDLRSIDLSGAADIEMETLKTDQLSLNVSGAGNTEIDNLQAERLDVTYSGAGKCRLGGEVQDQNIRFSGLGDYNADNLRSQTASVILSGAGNVEIWAEESLNIEVSGAGNVEYWGNPRVTQDISGIGNVQSLGSR